MTDDIYKKNMLKDVLKYSKEIPSKEEIIELMKSPLYEDKEYLTDACLLVKSYTITLKEFFCLRKLNKLELPLYLKKETYDFFQVPRIEEAMQPYLQMESKEKLTPHELAEDINNKERIDNIKRYSIKYLQGRK